MLSILINLGVSLFLILSIGVIAMLIAWWESIPRNQWRWEPSTMEEDLTRFTSETAQTSCKDRTRRAGTFQC